MARTGINHLLSYNYGFGVQLVNRLFVDKPFFTIQGNDNYCGFYRGNKQVVWVLQGNFCDHGKSMDIYINKVLQYEYNTNCLKIYVPHLRISYLFSDIFPYRMFFIEVASHGPLTSVNNWTVTETGGGWIVVQKQYHYEISRDPVQGMIDIYNWLMRGRAFRDLRKYMYRIGVSVG